MPEKFGPTQATTGFELPEAGMKLPENSSSGHLKYESRALSDVK